MVTTATQSWARTPGRSSTGQETTGTAGVGVFVAEQDRESFCGAKSFRQNHLSEAYSRPACGYLSV